MKIFLKFACAIIAVIIALSAVSCNKAMTSSNVTADTKQKNEALNDAFDNASSADSTVESEQSAKDTLLINANGILEESKRAALEAGVYMPEATMSRVSAGTYPIQGFLLSGSTPSDTYGNGMSVVYRLSDGSLFIFDGGSGYVRYLLYKCLKDLSGGGKIRVAAWVMTHSHGDHFGAMKPLLEGAYKNDFEIQEFWFNRSNNTTDGNGDGVALEKLFNKVAVGDTKV
ncbi:MAG: MBL fold metallo-hydrolase, partial [Clostridia bacterium]|nr:MBL fold metallo-hydrolase [Clostridia bacterium]